jgi:tetratricopeptide (TPR) repeat protein
MDTLDRLSIWAIVVLIITSFVLTGGHRGEAKPEKKQQKIAAADYVVINVEIENKIKVAGNLMESNNLEKAEILAKEMIEKFPYEGAPYMVMGDILMRRQEQIKAMPAYKSAVDLNPDYLDKKTPLFQGKKLKVAVNEALDEVEKEITAHPDNTSMKQSRKLIYYLKRRIAGSCG